jgi:uncharacterized protein
MFEQPVIEPARFARSRGRLEGTLQVAQLPRVADLVFDGAGTVRYVVSGYVDDRGYSALHVELDGELNLRCQRCLGPLSHTVRSEREIVLVPGADEFAQREDEADSEDVIPDVARLALAPLLEEELLLALPMATRHAEGACGTGLETPSAAPATSPFAALAKLKQ